MNIIINNKSYKDFLNYFINTWFTFLQSNNLLDYTNISKSFRSNCFIENYNGRIKRILGNKRLIQWPNLLSFLNKEEEYYREILILKDSEPRFNILKNKLEEYSQNFDNNVIIKKSQSKASHDNNIDLFNNIIDINDNSKDFLIITKIVVGLIHFYLH